MVKVCTLFQGKKNFEFDFDYYLKKHIPLSIELFSNASGFKGISAERGILIENTKIESSFVAMCFYYFETFDDFINAFAPIADKIQIDLRNFTNIDPIIQINEVNINIKT